MDDFLTYADSFESCLNSVNFVVDLFKYFGIKINFAKSSLIPSQTIDFLGCSLDAQKCRFTLTQDKLFKCRLIKCLSRLRFIGVKLLQLIGPLFGFWPLMLPNPLRPVLLMPNISSQIYFQSSSTSNRIYLKFG